MQLSFSQRAHLYNDLAVMLDSGMGFQSALRSLDHMGGRVGEVVRSMQSASESATSAFTAVQNVFGSFDVHLIEATEKAGRLAEGFRHLASYYEAHYQTKREISHQLIYPLVILHLGIFLFPILMLLESGVLAYLKMVGILLAIFYGTAVLIVFFFKKIIYWKSSMVGLDRWLRRIPVIRLFFRDAEDGRWSFVLYLQIRSGIPIRQALQSAAESSGSAWLKKVIPIAVQRIREGSRFWEALRDLDLHPMIIRSLRTGEESGRLADQLEQTASFLQQKNLQRLKLLGIWIPKIIYFLIILIIAAQVIMQFEKILGTYQSVLDEM